MVLLVHDLTPEIFGWPLDNYWTLKREAVIKADQIVAVSQATMMLYNSTTAVVP